MFSDFRSGLVCLAVGPDRALAAKTVGVDGAGQVGVRIEHVEHGGRAIPVLVWYPARDSAGIDPYHYNSGITGNAVPGAPVDSAGGPYPLILFSHGMGGCAPQHVFYNENLAAAGYVVVAPDHAESLMCHIEGDAQIGAGRLTWSVLKNAFNLSDVVFDLFGEMLEQRGYDFSYRPAEVRAVLDAALAWNAAPEHFLGGAVDAGRIGMSGHSLGGLTSLMVSGMPFLCGNDPPPAGECDFEDISLEHLPNPCCLDYVRENDPYQFRDRRIKAVLVMSPAIMFPDLPRAAAALEVPVMLINGDEFFEVPWEPVKSIYESAPSPKYLVRLKGTDHMTAVDSTLAMGPARLILPGFAMGFKDKADAYKKYSVAFFNLHLKGTDQGTEVLSRPLNKYVELWSENQ